MPNDCESYFIVYCAIGFAGGMVAALLIGLGLTTKQGGGNKK